MPAINPVAVSIVGRVSAREHRTILRALAHGLLAVQVETINHPESTLLELSTRLARQLDEHGIELRIRRGARK